MNLVFVGHVDHGKSTLIGRLLYDTDSLPDDKVEEIFRVCEEQGKDVEFAFVMDFLEEERSQGITIDTAKTFFRTEKREYIILDAPGHVEFIKNMITGASQADVAILLVDVHEGVQQQTKRHAFLLSLLGISQVIVVLNKIDMINYDENIIANVQKDVQDFLDKINVQPKHIIPLSAKTGENLARRSTNLSYTGPCFLEALDDFEEKTHKDGNFYLPVQDVYKIDDKRVYVGRVESGKASVNDELIILPKGTKTLLKSVEVFGEEKDSLSRGESSALTTKDPVFIERGDVIAKASEKQLVSATQKCTIFWIAKEFTKNFKIRCATQEINASLDIEKVLDSSTLEEKENVATNDVIIGSLSLDKELVVDYLVPELKRFIILQDDLVLGGGMFMQ